MKNGHTDSIYNLILLSILRYRNQIKVYLHKKRPPTGSLFENSCEPLYLSRRCSFRYKDCHSIFSVVSKTIPWLREISLLNHLLV